MAASYKAQGLFVTGFTKAEVLAIQVRAKADVLAGREITSYGDGGKNVGKTRVMEVGQILAECDYALKKLDPSTYGNNRASRRTHANFNTQLYK